MVPVPVVPTKHHHVSTTAQPSKQTDDNHAKKTKPKVSDAAFLHHITNNTTRVKKTHPKISGNPSTRSKSTDHNNKKPQHDLKTKPTTAVPQHLSPTVENTPKNASNKAPNNNPNSAPDNTPNIAPNDAPKEDNVANILYDLGEETGDRRRKRSVPVAQAIAQLDRLENPDSSFDTVFSASPVVGGNQLSLADGEITAVGFTILVNKDQGGTLMLKADFNASAIVSRVTNQVIMYGQLFIKMHAH